MKNDTGKRFSLKYERDAVASYVVLELDREESLIEYQLEMLTGDPAPGILGCSVQVENGVTRLCYDITSKLSLEAYVEKRLLKGQEFGELLLLLTQILEDSGRLFLDENRFLTEAEFVYLSSDGKPSLLYAPLASEQRDLKENVSQLFRFLSDKVEIGPGVGDAIQILSRELLKEDFTLKGFEDSIKGLALLQKKGMPKPINAQKQPSGWAEIPNLPAAKSNRAAEQGEKSGSKAGQGGKFGSKAGQGEKSGSKADRDAKSGSKAGAGGKFGSKAGAGGKSSSKSGSKAGRDAKSGTKAGASGKSGLPAGSTVGKRRSGDRKKTLVAVLLQVMLLLILAMTYFLEMLPQDTMQLAGIVILVFALDYLGVRRLLKKTEGESIEKENAAPAGNCTEETVLLAGAEEATVFMPEAAEAAAWLVSSENEGQDWMAVESNPYIIGKSASGVQLQIASKLVSRIHARIVREGGTFYLIDLGSTNGTFVNQVRLEPQTPQLLEPGDVIRFAKSEYTFQREQVR